jgi:putative acetyltransferase
MAIVIGREAPDSEEAVRLLQARDAELDSLYPPDNRFSIPVEEHVQSNLIFLMARENGTAIGTGVLSFQEGYAELKSMYVVPEARGRYVGAVIVDELERAAAAAGFEHLRLETGVRSPAAIKLYENSGFRRCARFGNYPDAPLSVFMEKRIRT